MTTIETFKYRNIYSYKATVASSKKHRDSKNDWRHSCEIKMNNLEFSQLLTNLKIFSEN